MPAKKSPARLTHLTRKGEARMVPVGEKPVTLRSAAAEALVRLGPESFEALRAGTLKKGDALAVARLAGIQAAKKTPDLIPLCHPLTLTGILVDIELEAKTRTARIRAQVACEAKTGAEMEAMTAASVAALALYDMLKGVERAIELGPIRLIEKRGGKSGTWRRGQKLTPLNPTKKT